METKWYTGYIIAGLIWYSSSVFIIRPVDGLVVFIVAVLAGLNYCKIKEQIKIQNETLRVIVSFFLMIAIAMVLVGVLTATVNSFL